jgi:NAD(P)-dependent dehydrogenase (short-subunit alcohol dehydrogenase family)
MQSPFKKLALAALGLVAARTAARSWQAARYQLAGRVVLITGGSRGLGLLLAREFAGNGCRLALVARDSAELERATHELTGTGADVLGVACDVTERTQVDAMLRQVTARFGHIDVLVNDAGRIEVGPFGAMRTSDFRESMETNFFGAINVIDAVLPELAPAARIVNIASIGGIVSVPHLLPYSASKFALRGYSLGLRSELFPCGIRVVTVCPGLMRTGSPAHVDVKGEHAAEYTLFSAADSLPLLSMDARRAARSIVGATRRGDAHVVLGMPAKLAAFVQGLMPGMLASAASGVARLLPNSTDPAVRRGSTIARQTPPWLTSLSDRAAVQNNELGAQR